MTVVDDVATSAETEPGGTPMRIVGFHDRITTIQPWAANSAAVNSNDWQAVQAAITDVIDAHRNEADPRVLIVPWGLSLPGGNLLQLNVPLVWPMGWPVLTECWIKIAEAGSHGPLLLISQAPARLAPGVRYPAHHQRLRPSAIDAALVPLETAWPKNQYRGAGERFGELLVVLSPDLHTDEQPSAEALWKLALGVAGTLTRDGARRIASELSQLEDTALEALAVEHDPGTSAAVARAAESVALAGAGKSMRNTAASVVDARRIAERLGARLMDPRGPNGSGGDLERVAETCRSAAAQIASAADGALEGLNAIAGAVSVQHLGAQATEAERNSKFQRIVGFIGAFVLLPGLVASIYGANVLLPGQSSSQGFAVLLCAMAATGALSLWALRAEDMTDEHVGWFNDPLQRALVVVASTLVIIAGLLTMGS